ncbi:T-complex protein 11-like protein 2 isoform X1 [Gasterosteus aculeatus]
MPLNDERPGGEDRVDEPSTSGLDGSRESIAGDHAAKSRSPSAGPPKTFTVDGVNESTRDLFNLRFAHEIIVNPSFHLQPDLLPQGSLWKMVKDNLHKAYWDILESELNDDPPEYGQAIRLLEEVREILLSMLRPGTNWMRAQITEVLDMDMIRQQADNDAVDIQGLASYIITIMGQMCSQVRDKDIEKLRQSPDNMVTRFKEIFRVLDLMKVDIVNFTIDDLRPVLMSPGVDFERATFHRILGDKPGALEITTAWIKSALEELSSSNTKEQCDGQEKGPRPPPGPFQLLNAAFLRILTWDYKKSALPETWMQDEKRLREIQCQLRQGQAVNAVLLIIYSTVGGPVQGLPSLSFRLMWNISVLLEGMHSPDFNLEKALESVSAQICCDLNKSLTERDYPALTPALQATLTGQICSIAQKDNPIRTLVEDRVQQYFTALLCDPKSQVKPIPAGLTPIQIELASIGAKFISLVNHNRRVYGPFYADIIKKLMFSSSPPAANPAQDTTPDPVSFK